MACNSHFHYRLCSTSAYRHHFPSNQCPVSVRSPVRLFPVTPCLGRFLSTNHDARTWEDQPLSTANIPTVAFWSVCCPPVIRNGSITCFLANTKEICTSYWFLSHSYIIWILGHTSFTGIKRCHTWIHSPLPHSSPSSCLLAANYPKGTQPQMIYGARYD